MTKFKYFLSAVLIICAFINQGFAQDKCPIKPALLKASINTQRQKLLSTIFPKVEAQNLKKANQIFPTDFTNKPTIAIVLFTDRGRPVANPWTQKLIANYKNTNVNIIELVMPGNGVKLLKGVITKGMRKEVDTFFHGNYYTYFGKAKPYKKQLLMTDKNSCYIFLLDKDSKIKYTTDGYISDEKWTTLNTKLEKLNSTQKESIVMASKDTIRIVIDPLCGFCYAFEPEMQKIIEAYKNKFVFDVIPGGMILGKDEGPIGKVAPHIAFGYKDLEKMSTSKFGDKFLNDVMKKGTYQMSSELPSIAITIFKSMQAQNTLAFAYGIQKMLYYDGTSLNDPENYRTLVNQFNLNADDFITKLTMPIWKTLTYETFAKAESLGVNGFPALVLKRDDTENLFQNGFENFENMKKVYPFAE
jgi:putative protein-disulfide isomerase